MVVAGNETTTKLLGNAVYHLARRPGAARPGVRRPARSVDAWIEETLRYDTSTQLLARLLDAGPHPARRHGARRDRSCCSGSGAANRDERVFTDPERFDLDRDPAELQQTLSFGGGRHFCLGANLARLEARVVLRELVRRCRQHRGRPRRGRAVLLRQRARLRAPAGDGERAMMRREYAQPTRRPAVVTGASSGIGAATALALAARGLPGGARGPPRRPVRGARRQDPGRRAARPSSTRSTCSDADSVAAFAEAVDRRPRRRRGGRLLRRRRRARRGPRDRLASGSPASSTSTSSAPTASCTPSCPAWSSGGAATSCSSPPTSRVRARPFMAAYAAGKWGLEGMAQSMQMELEGTGVRVSVVRPGPTWSEMGADWDDRGRRPTCSSHWVRFGHARHPHFLKPGRRRRRDHDRRVRAARRAPQPGRSHTRGPGGGPTRSSIREVSRRFPDSPYGHLEDLRTDPVDLLRAGARGVRRRRPVPAGRQGGRARLGRGGQRGSSSGRPTTTLDQAEAYPFMTPIFGQGVVFDASPEERQQMLKNQALRGEQMRGHAATIEDEVRRMVADWGDDGRDRPARLVRRADDLHDLVVPDRQAVPRGAGRLVRPATTTTSSAAPTPSRTSTRTPTSSPSAGATPPASELVELVQAIIDCAGSSAGRCPRRSATCSTC